MHAWKQLAKYINSKYHNYMEMYLHLCHSFGDSVGMWIACSCDAPHLLHHMILEASYYTTINVLHTKIL